jgi:hypothetical protein
MREMLRIHALQQPVQVGRLLEAFLTRANILPKNAYRIRDPEALPDALQRVMFNAAQEGRIWMSWAYGHRTWLFTCEESLASSTDRGVTVLHVNVYDKNGELMEAGAWAPDAQGKWQRCAA